MAFSSVEVLHWTSLRSAFSVRDSAQRVKVGFRWEPGYRGLNSAPLDVGKHEANGLIWTLYTATSNGRPVDIAMADFRGNSLVVMLFSHIDEHEALYRTVFLPMVDSAR
ncbi:MAG: hypothetical protein IPL71_20810 [Anaerolineales bacterium]|uniref:hypothetical protein n=1 Tax=Candidatus Villigracilis proximus TaxID=3140683 RepID=UPI003136AAA4|nr:hypothetical protein [Anaerolineales bacterium]